MNRMNKLKKSFIILNNKGLHTRPATELVRCASVFKSEIILIYEGISVSARSLLGILMLAARPGTEIEVEARGVDAEEAIQSIVELAKNKFNIQY